MPQGPRIVQPDERRFDPKAEELARAWAAGLIEPLRSYYLARFDREDDAPSQQDLAAELGISRTRVRGGACCRRMRSRWGGRGSGCGGQAAERKVCLPESQSPGRHRVHAVIADRALDREEVARASTDQTRRDTIRARVSVEIIVQAREPIR